MSGKGSFIKYKTLAFFLVPVILAFMDMALTQAVLQNGGYECNPIVCSLIEQFGFTTAAIVIILTIYVIQFVQFCVFTVFTNKYIRVFTSAGTCTLIVHYIYLVVHNSAVLYYLVNGGYVLW